MHDWAPFNPPSPCPIFPSLIFPSQAHPFPAAGDWKKTRGVDAWQQAARFLLASRDGAKARLPTFQVLEHSRSPPWRFCLAAAERVVGTLRLRVTHSLPVTSGPSLSRRFASRHEKFPGTGLGGVTCSTRLAGTSCCCCLCLTLEDAPAPPQPL